MILQYFSNDGWVQLGVVMAFASIIILAQIHRYWLTATMITKPLNDTIAELKIEINQKGATIRELRTELYQRNEKDAGKKVK